MKKAHLTLLTILLAMHFVFGQVQLEMDSLLNQIALTQNSKQIELTEPAQSIIKAGKESLRELATYFDDQSVTKVWSDCQERTLTRGELAIILADRIEIMPYGHLTGVQHCTLTFCEGNPNRIEYFFGAIKRDGVEAFQIKYLEWLSSEEREGWLE